MPLDIVEVDPEHTDFLVLELLSQGIQLRYLGTARPAPFCPVVEDQPFAVQSVGGDLVAVLVDAIVITAAPQHQRSDDRQCCCQSPCHVVFLVKN
ncbi:hypothetical protein D3C85_1404170 [compost metagenome]